MSKRNKSQSKAQLQSKELSQKNISPNGNKHKKQPIDQNSSFFSAVEKSPQQINVPQQAPQNRYHCLHEGNKQIWKNICHWSQDFSKLNAEVCEKFENKNSAIRDITFRLEREAIQIFQQALCKIPLRIIDQINSIDKSNKKKLSILEQYLKETQSMLQKQKKQLFQSNASLPDQFHKRTLLPHKQEIENVLKQVNDCKTNIDKLLRFQSHAKTYTESIKLMTVQQTGYSYILCDINQGQPKKGSFGNTIETTDDYQKRYF